MNNNIVLPKYSWDLYDKMIKSIAEGEAELGVEEHLSFLRSISFVDNNGLLTDEGYNYYQSKFIKKKEADSREILKSALLKFSTVEAVLQLLFGVEKADVDTVTSIIKSRGFWDSNTKCSYVINLLTLLNKLGLLVYSKKFRTVKVIFNPNLQNKVPEAIFIDPAKPFSNILWLKKILKECNGFIYWIDKHFQKEGMEYILEIADASVISEIKILSIAIPSNSDKKTKDCYFRLKKELANKNISLAWFVIEPSKIRDNHDRWILTKNKGWNLPPIGSIFSGQRSEIYKSKNYSEVQIGFDRYIKEANELL